MELTKVKSYLGFAEKSRNILLGTDKILSSKGAKIIIVSDELSLSSLEKLNRFAEKLKIELIKLKNEDFSKIYERAGVKALAVKESNLAKAITKNLSNDC